MMKADYVFFKFLNKKNNVLRLSGASFKLAILSILFAISLGGLPHRLEAQGFESITNLVPVPATKNTGEKPQSKVWNYAGKWWTVSPNNTGTWILRLDGTSWTSVLRISTNTTFKADCKLAGDVVHILLWKTGTSQLVSVEYVPESSNYQFWNEKPDPVMTSIALDNGVEIATIDIDGTGRMWLASDGINDVRIRWSDPPYSSWSSPIIIATGITDDDISVVTSLPAQGQIGVLWSNQNTRGFGFKTHVNGEDPTIWSEDELPASQSALEIGNGMADDHMNLALAADGTLYCAVKTSYDRTGYPNISLLKRNPSGNWDNLYGISETGTRPIVVLNESIGKLKVIYAASESGGDIIYTESSTSTISFGSVQTLMSGFYSNPTSTKDNYDSEIVILASDATSPSNTSFVGVLAKDSPPLRAPETPVLSSPIASEVNIDLSPLLSWNSSEFSASYQVQVSTTSNFSSLLIDETAGETTSLQVSGLTGDNIYFWRVRAMNSIGISDWSSVWSFTTTTATVPLPDIPNLLSPVNSGMGVATNPTLSWNASDNATTYRVQVSMNQDFSSTLIDETNVAGISFSFTGLSNNNLYYWRVQSENSSGTSPWSDTWSFVTISLPTIPLLLSPADLATNVSTSSILDWNASDNTTSYQVQLSMILDFSSLVVDEIDVETTSISVTGLNNNTVYYWRIRSLNSSGISPWSAVSSFTTIPLPSVPLLLSPSDLVFDISTNPILSWQTAANATIYQAQISMVSDFSSVTNELNTDATSTSVTGLINNSIYYWRIRSLNSSGVSSWSAVWSFKTIPVPSIPAPLYPADLATNVVTNPTLSWEASQNATSYELQISMISDFSSILIDEVGIPSISFQSSELDNNTIYYWRVRATNFDGSSAWSETKSFTTIAALPEIPKLLNPLDLSKDISVAPILNWNASANASAYQIQISVLSDFSSVAIEINTEATAIAVNGLINGTPYYWRVRSVNPSGVSLWSSVWSFTTITRPHVPILVFPTGIETNIATNPILTWSASENAVTYQVQISVTSDFSSLLIDVKDIAITTYQAIGLTNSTNYYWRVRASNFDGSSEWSSPESFATISKTLVGNWNMNEGSGTILLDDSGFGNNAIINGNPVWVPAPSHGLALKLNGADQYATVIDAFSLDVRPEITLSAWVRPERKASQQLIQLGNTNDGYELLLLNTGEILFQFNQGTSILYKLISKYSYPVDGVTWMHIAATSDGSTFKIYINGVENGSLVLASPIPIIINQISLSIGKRSDGSNSFKGTIDDVRTYNFALTDAEILDMISKSGNITGIENDNEAIDYNFRRNQMHIYPNPVEDILSLEFSTDLQLEYSISIMDLYGRICFNAVSAGSKSEINLKYLNLKPGLYFIILKFAGHNESRVVKFIKK